MTQFEPDPPPHSGIKETPPRLRRSATDKMVGGVCGGLGRFFGVDSVWFRLGFVVTTLLGGSGALIYLVAWIVIPMESPGEVTAAAAGKDVGPDASIIAGAALVGIGLMLLANTFVPWFSRVIWPLAVVTAGVGLIYLGTQREQR